MTFTLKLDISMRLKDFRLKIVIRYYVIWLVGMVGMVGMAAGLLQMFSFVVVVVAMESEDE